MVCLGANSHLDDQVVDGFKSLRKYRWDQGIDRNNLPETSRLRLFKEATLWPWRSSPTINKKYNDFLWTLEFSYQSIGNPFLNTLPKVLGKRKQRSTWCVLRLSAVQYKHWSYQSDFDRRLAFVVRLMGIFYIAVSPSCTENQLATNNNKY